MLESRERLVPAISTSVSLLILRRCIIYHSNRFVVNVVPKQRRMLISLDDELL